MSTIGDKRSATMGDRWSAIIWSMSVAERIADLLRETGRSQTEIARAAKVGRGAISAIVRGRTKNPQPDHLFAIADAFGVEARWLATGQGPKYRETSLSREQRDWLNMYEQLPPDKRQAARAILDPRGEYRIDDPAKQNS